MYEKENINLSFVSKDNFHNLLIILRRFSYVK